MGNLAEFIKGERQGDVSVCHILISGEDRINRCPYYP